MIRFSGQIRDPANCFPADSGSFEWRVNPDERLRRFVVQAAVNVVHVKRAVPFRLLRPQSNPGITCDVNGARSTAPASAELQQRRLCARPPPGQRWKEALRK